MKKITVCGSLRFQKEMMEMAEKLELCGNCVITPIYPVRADKADYTDKENLIAWLLSFRDQVCLLEPEEIRGEIRECIERMRKNYSL